MFAFMAVSQGQNADTTKKCRQTSECATFTQYCASGGVCVARKEMQAQCSRSDLNAVQDNPELMCEICEGCGCKNGYCGVGMGGTCSSNDQCVPSEYCKVESRRCVPLIPIGSACQGAHDDLGECVNTGFCGLSKDNNRVCISKYNNGQLCAIGRSCVSGYCNSKTRLCADDPAYETTSWLTPSMAVLVTLFGCAGVCIFFGICIWLIRDHQREIKIEKRMSMMNLEA